MSTLRILLGPDGPAGGLPGVLADLSAASLLEPYLWVQASDVRPQTRVPAVMVTRGRRRATTVADALADEAPALVRLCVAVPLSGDPVVDPDVEDALVELVSEWRRNPTPPTKIRCVVGRVGDHVDREILARPAWHNVYIAPEDAEGPGDNSGLVLLTAEEDDAVNLARLAAPTIAGVVGLWTGVNDCEFDGDTQYPPYAARLARGFYRRVDADEVEHALRRRVLSTADGSPRPHDDEGEVTYAVDAGAACRQMAERWWKAHRFRVVDDRVEPRAGQIVPVGRMAALRLFLQFVRETLLGAPRNFLEVARNKVRVETAMALTEVVFGGPESAYRVVVDGVAGNRLPVGLVELREQAAELDRRVAATGGKHYRQPPAPPDLSPMWRDYALGALTLVDAGKRTNDLPPISDNAGRSVVQRSPEQAVPGPREAFFVTGNLAARVGPELARIDAGDVVATRLLRRWLDRLARDAALEVEVSDTLARLIEWSRRYEPTYAAAVGRRLDDTITEVRGQIRTYAEDLREAKDYPDPPQRGRMSRLRWVLTFLLAWVVVPVALLLTWLWLDLIDWWLAVGLIVVSLVAWLVGAARRYVRDRLEIEQAARRRTALLTKVAAAEMNLRQALIDVQRLSGAYDQYRVYNRIVGAILAAPFGPDPAPPAPSAVLAYGLPRSVRIAWARADDTTVGSVAEQLRKETFRTGWLTGPWEAHRDQAGVRLKSHVLQQEAKARKDALFELHGGDVKGTDLDRWSRLLAAEGTSSEPGDAKWVELLDWIRRPEGSLDHRLLSSVEEIGLRGEHEARRRGRVSEIGRYAVPLEEFLAGADRPRPGAASPAFWPRHFVGNAYLDGMSDVVPGREPTPVRLGLSRVHVLVQLSGAVPSADFAAAAPDPGRAAGPPPPPPSLAEDLDDAGGHPADGVEEPVTTGSRIPPVPQGEM